MKPKLPFSFKQCASALLQVGGLVLALGCSSETEQPAGEIPAVEQTSQGLQLGDTCSTANDQCTDANTECRVSAGVASCQCVAGTNNTVVADVNDGTLCLEDISCAGVTCGGVSAGTCSDATGVPVCTCLGGYNKFANPLVCVANTTCAANANYCGDNGTCDDTAAGSAPLGVLECTCDQGWAGTTCNTCDTGYANAPGGGADCNACATGYHFEDEDNNVATPNTCQPNDCTYLDNGVAGSYCGDNGTCADDPDTGIGECECENGYEGDGCDECSTGYANTAGGAPDCDSCAAGYHDGDTGTAGNQCVANTTCASEGAVGCGGGNGACTSNLGYPVCTCSTGYNNVANPLACVADVECPATNACGGATAGTCDDSTGVPVCTCLNGYNNSANPAVCVADETCPPAAQICGGAVAGTCSIPVASNPATGAQEGLRFCTCNAGYNNNEDPLVCVANVDCSNMNACSGRGECTEVVAGETISCDCEGNWGGDICAECAQGYDGDDCEDCADGYNDVEEPGTCVADVACAVDSCSEHGTCVDTTGVPVCTCDDGYEGDACDECADGYTDVMGACVLDEAEAGVDAGPEDGGAVADDAGSDAGSDDVVTDDIIVTDEATDDETDVIEAGVTDEATDDETDVIEAGVTDEATDDETDVIEAGVTDEATDEETDEATDEATDEETDEATDEATDEETDEIVDEETDEATDESTDDEETDTDPGVGDAGADAGVGGGGSDDGCDCSVPGRTSNSNGLASLAGLAFAAAVVARRRRKAA